MKQPIELRKLRDFGQVINDSFTFFKENFKPLFTVLITICGFFLLISTITSVFTYMHLADLFGGGLFNQDNGNRLSYDLTNLFNALILLLTQAFIHLVTLCYISVYLQKNNNAPNLAEVWGYFKYYFFRAMGSGILIVLLSIIALLFCIIPGIYVIPIFYLIIPIIVIENSSFRYAFNKSFKLIKDNWWFVFGIILIMGLIVSVADSVATIPMTVISAGSKFLSTRSFALPVIIIFSIVHGIIILAYALPSIAISMCYFDLSEQKEGTGLLDRIEKVGKNDDNSSTLPAEEY